MASYRFCRTDDVALLVAAYNRCYHPHFPDAPAMTVERFRRLIRERNLWCSSCMVAHDGDDAIAVLLAAKRPTENLILALGVHPAHLGRAHGRHLLTSLGDKLAILGPPRMLAEVPADLPAACAFFESCGWARERTHVDFERAPSPGSERGAGQAVVTVTVDELSDGGALEAAAPRCWERSRQTILNCRDDLEGIAIATDRFEAWLLYSAPAEGPREIVGFGCADPARRDPLLGLLVDHCRAGGAGLRFRKVSEDEVAFTALERLGFRRGREHVLYTFTAG